MDWQDLRAVLAIAETGSFTDAADRLHLTQPAVSRRVRELESRLGVRLFDRLGRTVRPTAAAELLLPRARDILLAVQDAETVLQSLDDEVVGTLRLATSHHIGLHRLAPTLKAFSQRHPEMSFDIRFEDSEVAHELVRQAESELAVVTLDPQGAGDLHYEQIWCDDLAFVAAADHPLTAQPSVTLAQLAESACVLPDLGTYTCRIVNAVFAQAGVDLKPAMATNYLETIAMLVGIGVGWSALPASMLNQDVQRLPATTKLPSRQLGLVSNPRRPMSNTARRFAETLRRTARP